ncbi:MAG: choice-of-anchor Q domain-containing protein [Myxococcota bacterium]
MGTSEPPRISSEWHLSAAPGNPACGRNLSLPNLGFNVFEDDSCLAAPNDLVNTDLWLDVLKENGGFTPTMLPFSNSPLVDAINGQVYPWDQRGLPRIAGESDIGAAECQQNECEEF